MPAITCAWVQNVTRANKRNAMLRRACYVTERKPLRPLCMNGQLWYRLQGSTTNRRAWYVREARAVISKGLSGYGTAGLDNRMSRCVASAATITQRAIQVVQLDPLYGSCAACSVCYSMGGGVVCRSSFLTLPRLKDARPESLYTHTHTHTHTRAHTRTRAACLACLLLPYCLSCIVSGVQLIAARAHVWL